MKLEFVKYNSKYLKSCAKLLSETWSYNDEIKNTSQLCHLYYYYIRNCLNNSIYTDLIIDIETESVLGILIGSNENNTTWKSSINNFKNLSILFKHIIFGHLGKRFNAIKCIKNILTIEKDIEKYCETFNSQINLFVLSKQIQGQGYGTKLMNRFILFCKNKQKDIENIFVWTDIGCNYGFYQHYGFTLFKRFYDERLTEHDDQTIDEPNAFIYVINI